MSAKDSQGNAIAVGDKVTTTTEITIAGKGSIPAGTTLTVEAFGRTANHVDVSYQGKKWYVDGNTVKKS